MKKLFLSCLFCLAALVAASEVYHAGETKPAQQAFGRFEVSVGWDFSNMSMSDRVERMFKKQDGLTARALFYPLRWLGVGAEGVWFGEKNSYQNTYRDTRYGIVAKGIITPDTLPELYVLLGGGKDKQEVTYAGRFDRSQTSNYGQLGLGLSATLYQGIFLAVEGRAI